MMEFRRIFQLDRKVFSSVKTSCMLTWTVKGIVVDRIVMRITGPQGGGKASSRVRGTEHDWTLPTNLVISTAAHNSGTQKRKRTH